MLIGAAENQIDSRTWLNIVGFLLKRTATKSAKRVAREMDFDWSGLLPWAVLKASQDPKLTRFVEDCSRPRSQSGNGLGSSEMAAGPGG
jgi:hypothetical protein